MRLSLGLVKITFVSSYSMTVPERFTLLKALVPGIASEMSATDFERLISELRLKGERFYEARNHPNEGRATRHVMGERDVEGRQ